MTSATTRTKEEAEVRSVAEALTSAVQRKDADAVVSLFTQDNVMFVLAPPLQVQSDASSGRQGLEEWFATWQGDPGYETRDMHITAGDDVAFCHSLNRLSGRKTDGETVDLWHRNTLCFRKENGDWKIAHQHQSVPFYMDGSGKAALDLQP
jgi:PhnB protein